MKESLNTLIRGAYFGFGVSIVWIMMVTANDILLSPKIEELHKQRELTLLKNQRGKLDIESIDISHAENGIVANIKISNNSEKPAHSILLETEIFDNNGRFLGECIKQASWGLAPGQYEYAQVHCSERKRGQYDNADLTRIKFTFAL